MTVRLFAREREGERRCVSKGRCGKRQGEEKEKSFAKEEPDVGGRMMNGCAWTDRVRRPHEPNREGEKRVNLDDFLPFSKICQST